MKLKKLNIKGTFAHFKIPAYSKYQRTFDIPPISTVVGILKNIYGEDIDQFTLGYTINYRTKSMDATTIYKEVDLTEKSPTDSKRGITDICFIEYLYDVQLTIYTDIFREEVIKDTLVLGKTNCLGTLTSIEEVELIDKCGYGINQYTDKNIGTGLIRNINTLTEFNPNTDRYDAMGAIVRENQKFSYDKNFDNELGQNIYLWSWNGGKINGLN